MDTIELFMWGYQRHAISSFQHSAEDLLGKLGIASKPNVYFVGVLAVNDNGKHPICIEPDDTGYSPNDFSTISTLAEELKKSSKESMILHSHPIAQESHDKYLDISSISKAILISIEKKDFFNEKKRYISYPSFIEGYQVFTVLEIDKSSINDLYQLHQNTKGQFHVETSLFDSCAKVFLGEVSDSLRNPDKGISYIDRPSEEIIRESAKQFMGSIAIAGGSINGAHGLYEACNTISSLKYEGADGLGKMAICNVSKETISYSLKLKQPILIRESRKVRKFLEIVNNDSIIISDSEYIYGIGEIQGKYNPTKESIFEINFTSHYKWSVFHDGNLLMGVEYRQPYIIKKGINLNKVGLDLERIFAGIEDDNVTDLLNAISESTKQKHGTMLVISDAAEKEAQRLSGQSFPIKPTKISKDLILQVTSIDGAVLLDRTGACYAIGVILDGIATMNGDSSRGARYNSAIRYFDLKSKDSALLIVIVSEDGMINIIPNLMPKIKHSEILERIKKLEELGKLDKPERRDFYKVHSFLESRSFYLSEDECNLINELVENIEEKMFANNKMKIEHEILKPNITMNSSYYEDE